MREWLARVRSGVREVYIVLDASFIKAWSVRHPRESARARLKLV